RPPDTPGGVGAHPALHRPQDGADGDLVGGVAQPVPAGRAATGQEKPGALELQEHLLEIALGNRLPSGDVLDRLQLFSVAQRQVEQGANRVFPFRREPHRRAGQARPCSISRAMSLAKYVMMMSAPARRIDVSASTMTRSSSSQPSWPAARLMAYS